MARLTFAAALVVLLLAVSATARELLKKPQGCTSGGTNLGSCAVCKNKMKCATCAADPSGAAWYPVKGGACAQCPANCTACRAMSGGCTACASSYGLHGNKCVACDGAGQVVDAKGRCKKEKNSNSNSNSQPEDPADS